MAVRGVSPIVTYDLFRILHFYLMFKESYHTETKKDVERSHEKNIFSVRPQVNTTSET